MEDFRKMYLAEKVQRLRVEMTLMQERFSNHQVVLQEAERELKFIIENEKKETQPNEEFSDEVKNIKEEIEEV